MELRLRPLTLDDETEPELRTPSWRVEKFMFLLGQLEHGLHRRADRGVMAVAITSERVSSDARIASGCPEPGTATSVPSANGTRTASP